MVPFLGMTLANSLQLFGIMPTAPLGHDPIRKVCNFSGSCRPAGRGVCLVGEERAKTSGPAGALADNADADNGDGRFHRRLYRAGSVVRQGGKKDHSRQPEGGREDFIKHVRNGHAGQIGTEAASHELVSIRQHPTHPEET